jgi:prefoldin beta subunit
MNKETEKKIQQLQLLEQNLNSIMMQKQTFQMQLAENENAIDELERTKKDAYKIIGTIMVSSDKNELKEELKEQKDILDLRIKNLEKQEKNFKEKAEDIQKEVMKDI